MTIFDIPNPTQYINLTTTLLTINKLQISLIEAKVLVNGPVMARINKVWLIFLMKPQRFMSLLKVHYTQTFKF